MGVSCRQLATPSSGDTPELSVLEAQTKDPAPLPHPAAPPGSLVGGSGELEARLVGVITPPFHLFICSAPAPKGSLTGCGWKRGPLGGEEEEEEKEQEEEM